MKRARDIRCILSIDQAELSGWAIGDNGDFAAIPYGGPRSYELGTARTPDERKAVLVRAADWAGGEQHLAVVFEDHSSFHFGRGNASVATLLGLGAHKGRWEEQLDALAHPRSLRFKVTPRVWRKAVLGLAPNCSADRAKETARLYARAALGRAAGADESEAFCILRLAQSGTLFKSKQQRESA